MIELTNIIAQFLANRPFHALFLYVSPEISRLNVTTKILMQEYGWPHLSLSQALATSLQDIAPARLSRQARLNLLDMIGDFQPGPVLCTDIDLVFEPSLELNPLQLFLNCSRQTALVIAWSGNFQNDTLTYAVPEHAHYRAWKQPELCDYCLARI